MSEHVVFINGEFIDEAAAKISVFDHAFLYGDGVFETAIAWRDRIFKLEAHLDRLFRSLTAVKLDPPHPRSVLRELIIETVRRNHLSNAYIKCVITRGTTSEPLLDTRGAHPGCVIFARPFLSLVAPEKVQVGVRLKTVATRRVGLASLDPRIKSLNYLNLVLAKLEAQASGADEALLLDDQGHVSEGSGFNIFAVHGRRLMTPEVGVLEGITRATVLELGPDLGLHGGPMDMSLYDLYTADEVFLTSTAGGLIPVVEVDGRPIGAGVPGAVIGQLASAYEELIGSETYGTPTHA